jgi:unsaturated rhamnogalacturonyl hydrolase
MKLFNTNGVSQDDYRVGKTRGCGGLGVWQDGQLYVSKNWRTYNLITTGPIRSEFELTYEAWTAGGRTVSETKRISIDAGSSLSRFESTFHSDDASPLEIAIGLAERPGENVVVPDGAPDIAAWTRTTAKGLVVQSQLEGWMTYWQPQDFAKGTTAVAIILPRGSIESFTNDKPNLPASAFLPPTKTFGEGQAAIRDFLAICRATPDQPFAYYLGAGWDESVDFTNAKAWNDYVRQFTERRDKPLQVTVGN